MRAGARVDVAHGFGALHDGRPLGGGGAAEVFSMSPTKLLVTGEGGVVATDDRALAEELRVLREYGNPGDYDSRSVGLNARLPEIAAIMGSEGLAVLEANAVGRNTIAQRYARLLANVPGIGVQRVDPRDRSSYKDFSILVLPDEYGATRDELLDHLGSRGVETQRRRRPAGSSPACLPDVRGAVRSRPLSNTNWVSERVTSQVVGPGCRTTMSTT